jgi:site-specific DNA recombinase
VKQSTPSPASPGVRAAIYCRVSTDRQEREGTSLDSQRERSLAYAAERGYRVDDRHVFREAASGTTWRDREKLQALLAAARAGEFSVLIVYATDRLSRKQVHSGVILDRLQEASVRLESVTEPDIDETALGQFLRAVRAFVAESENEDRAERSVRGKLTRIKNGKLHNHGTDLYGYRRDKAVGVRVVEEREAEIVMRIYGWCALDRLPTRAIIRRLNAEGIPAPSVSGVKRVYKDGHTPLWQHSTVYRILTEPAYKGDTVLWRYRSHGNHKRAEMRPEADRIHLDGVTPAIVSPELWQAVQDRLTTTTGATTRNGARPYLLRGLISCDVCGLPMRTQPEHGRRVYRCSSREKACGACGGKRVPADVVEAELWTELEAFFSDDERVEAEVARLRARDDATGLAAERARAQERANRFQRQVEALGERLRTVAADDVMWGVIEGQIRQAERERKEAAGDLDAAERAIAAHEAAIAHLEDVRTYRARVAPNMASFGFAEKRDALEALDLRVYANGRDWYAKGGIPGEEVGVLLRSC